MTMDTLLVDIKNFLKKLEHGQLDIEAGQWELHKDIANVKKSVEELKKLKEDVEIMRINNAEQKELIKNLEAKLEMLGSQLKNDEPVTVSQSSVEYETIYRVPAGDQRVPPKGYKKRKCHRVRSEEIIEITSNISDKKSTSSDNEEAHMIEKDGQEKETKEDQQSEDNSNASINNVHVQPDVVQNNSKVRYQSHPGNGILQRYLKDSAKYRERNASCSTDMTGVNSRMSHSICSRNETYSGNFWDEYGLRVPAGHNNRAATRAKKKASSESIKTTDTVIPERLICPKNPKKFTFNPDFPDKDPNVRRARSVKHIYQCRVCGKGFSSKSFLRMHIANHDCSENTQKGFKCSYCEKMCTTPEKLTLHLKNCRIIMRSHRRKRRPAG